MVLLLMVLSLLAAAGNWVAVGATLAALGGVVVATFVLIRPWGRPRRAFDRPSAGADRDGMNLRRTHEHGESEPWFRAWRPRGWIPSVWST